MSSSPGIPADKTTGNPGAPRTDSQTTTTHAKPEAPDQQGTMGGTAPLPAKAGIQSLDKDGVLTGVDVKP